ncbi:MAG: carboxypeptidase-like regulatory domain-containing protein [Bacteroidota bacterium]
MARLSPAVNVVLKGTTNGTVSDANGNYKMTIPDGNGTLVFSFIGLKSQEVEIGGRAVLDVKMELDVTQLSEVVVTTARWSPVKAARTRFLNHCNFPQQSHCR